MYVVAYEKPVFLDQALRGSHERLFTPTICTPIIIAFSTPQARTLHKSVDESSLRMRMSDGVLHVYMYKNFTGIDWSRRLKMKFICFIFIQNYDTP